MNVSHGFHVFRDGSAWCAVGPTFIDMMKSDVAFGDTPEDAVIALRSIFLSKRWWINKTLPNFDEFTVHSVSSHHKTPGEN